MRLLPGRRNSESSSARPPGRGSMSSGALTPPSTSGVAAAGRAREQASQADQACIRMRSHPGTSTEHTLAIRAGGYPTAARPRGNRKLMAHHAAAPAATSAHTEEGHADLPDLRVFVFALFFIFGGITSLNDVIIPKLKELFTLSYAQAMLVQFGVLLRLLRGLAAGAPPSCARIGYMRTAAVGLLTMTAGCLLFIPASQSARVPAVPARAVRARGRHHHRAGGRQPADLAARPARARRTAG